MYGKFFLVSFCVSCLFTGKFIFKLLRLPQKIKPVLSVKLLPTSVVSDEFYIQQNMLSSKDELWKKNKNSLSVYQGILSPGETFTLLAYRSGLQIGTLLSINKIKNLEDVYVGMRYSIPTIDGILHCVRSGQTLRKLSNHYGVSVRKLQQVNKLLISDLQKGQELFIPHCFLTHAQIKKIIGKSFLFPVPGRVIRFFGEVHNNLTDTLVYNDGIDIATLPNQDVYAVAPGKVVSHGLHSLYGYYLILEHEQSLHTFYGYLDGIIYEIGEEIQRGKIIGKVGDSGYTNGQWLHFTVLYKNKPVNPLKYLR